MLFLFFIAHTLYTETTPKHIQHMQSMTENGRRIIVLLKNKNIMNILRNKVSIVEIRRTIDLRKMMMGLWIWKKTWI